jgi:hypothetical protein
MNINERNYPENRESNYEIALSLRHHISVSPGRSFGQRMLTGDYTF